jgi:hypothetical protein
MMRVRLKGLTGNPKPWERVRPREDERAKLAASSSRDLGSIAANNLQYGIVDIAMGRWGWNLPAARSWQYLSQSVVDWVQL